MFIGHLYFFFYELPIHALYSSAYYWLKFLLIFQRYMLFYANWAYYKYIHLNLDPFPCMYIIYHVAFYEVTIIYFASLPLDGHLDCFLFFPMANKKQHMLHLCTWLHVYNINKIVIGMSMGTCISDIDRYFQFAL